MKNLRSKNRPVETEGRTGHTKSDIEYRAAPYGFIAVIPKGTTVVEARNLPAKNGSRWWARPWSGMKESEEAWMRNYGFLLEDQEVRNAETRTEVRTFQICGTHGELTVRLSDGEVIARSPEDAYAEEVMRVDVNEWHRAYPDENPAGSHDILDFGTWNALGGYEGPEETWRIERSDLIQENREKQRTWASGNKKK